MSWREAPHRRRLLAAALLLPLALGGCNIHPLYGAAAPGDVTTQDKLAGIVIDQVPDRFGHYLVQELGFALDGSGTDSAKARYRLSIKTTESVNSSIVNTITGNATAAYVSGSANYTLTRIGTDEVVYSGSASAIASYTRNEQRFASVRAARDAEIRVAEQLAEQIRNRLAAKLSTTKG
ncbi:MAG: LPS assembly lipoprotein LptE [Alsobacter sp.]